jgi:response regulator of citrate/malate metabolism
MQNNQNISTSPAVYAIVESFAKANKISKAKMMQFATEVAQAPKMRKINPNTAALRTAIVEVAKKNKQGFTTAEIVEHTGVADKVTINNQLTSLFKEGVITRTGETRKVGVGKPANVWTIA